MELICTYLYKNHRINDIEQVYKNPACTNEA